MFLGGSGAILCPLLEGIGDPFPLISWILICLELETRGDIVVLIGLLTDILAQLFGSTRAFKVEPINELLDNFGCGLLFSNGVFFWALLVPKPLGDLFGRLA